VFEPAPVPPVTTGFRILPRATAIHSSEKTSYLLSGSFGSAKPIRSITLYRAGLVVGRTKYWCPPHVETMMHNLGVIQYAFAFGIWVPFAEAVAETLALEALDSVGDVSQAEIQCVRGDEGDWNQISLRCEGSEPLGALPTEPPISIQLEEARVSGATLRVRGSIAARSRIAKAVVAAAGGSSTVALRQRGANVVEGHKLLPNAVQDFAAQLRLDAGHRMTPVEVIAASDDGAEYYGAFPIDGVADALGVTSNLEQVHGNGDRGPLPVAVIYVEYPRIENGVAVLKGRQQFRLAGWAVGRREIERLNVYVDGKLVGNAAYGVPRPDVAQVFPQWPHAARSGFNLLIDNRPLLQNPTTIMLEARLSGGGEEVGRFQLRFGDPEVEDKFLDILISDQEIWRFARTLKMFAAGIENEILNELQDKAVRWEDVIEITKVQQIRAALVILGDAWRGRSIDRKVAQSLREWGFL
jgi:hypothetical protein